MASLKSIVSEQALVVLELLGLDLTARPGEPWEPWGFGLDLTAQQGEPLAPLSFELD